MKKCQGVRAPSGDRSIRSSIGRRSSGWGFVPCGSFPCGFGSKNKLRESKTARKIGRVKELGGSELSFPVPCRSSVFLRSETTPKRLLHRLPCGLSEQERRLISRKAAGNRAIEPRHSHTGKIKTNGWTKKNFRDKKNKSRLCFRLIDLKNMK